MVVAGLKGENTTWLVVTGGAGGTNVFPGFEKSFEKGPCFFIVEPGVVKVSYLAGVPSKCNLGIIMPWLNAGYTLLLLGVIC